jgi:hypothetical protein
MVPFFQSGIELERPEIDTWEDVAEGTDVGNANG